MSSEPRRSTALVACLAVAFAAVLSLSSGAPLVRAEGTGPDDASVQLRRSVEAAAERLAPSIVRIRVVAKSAHQGRVVRHEATGSGVVVSPDGYVITNHHVAGHAVRLVGTMHDNEEIDARLVGTDPLSDIAVIQLLPEEERAFPVAKFGDSAELRVGDRVLAMGSPLSLSQSVTLGIVSNTRMVMPSQFWPSDRFVLDGEDVGSIVRWIGHDAAIYPGNSGGPLVNLAGEVIGINEISFGLSGAIPGNLALEVSRDLIEHGRVPRSWIGLEVQPLLTEMRSGPGVLVAGAMPGSPAAEAGFASGDVLVEIGGEPVSVHFREELPAFNRTVAGLPIGEETEAVVRRGKETMRLAVRTIEREPVEPEEVELKRWGITVRDLSRVIALEKRLESRDGVLVTTVRPGGPSGDARPPIREGDVVVAVAGEPVTGVGSLVTATDRLVGDADEPRPTLVTFRRDAEEVLTVVEVGIDPLRSSPREVKKAWLPVELQVLTRELAAQVGRPDTTGVRLTQVFPDSTAEAAGLRVGDLVIALDGEPIPASHPEDYEVLPAMIRQYPVGSTPELLVVRGGEERRIPVELERAPELPREAVRHRDDVFEFTARDVSPIDRVREGWKDDVAGVLVTEVTQGGWAAIGHLAVGDLIESIDGERVPDVEALVAILERMAEERAKRVTVRVRRGVHTVFLELQADWGPTS